MAVTQLSNYRIEEESAERLVLRMKKTAFFFGGGFLLLAGLAFFYAGLTGTHPMSAGAVAVIVIGLLTALGGAALVRAGIRNKSRITFDQEKREVRLDLSRKKSPTVLPYDSLDSVTMDFEEKVHRDSQSRRDERYTVFVVNLVDKNGAKTRIDGATNAKRMFELATKVGNRCGVPFAGGSQQA
jgi:hypothetical protein